MTIVAIIVAAGRGTRAGGNGPKQWQPFRGRPLIATTLDAFAGFDRLLVVHPSDRSLAGAFGVGTIDGGASRTASVRNALDSLRGKGITRVLIHDGARPLVSRAVIDRVLTALDRTAGAAPALPVTDALWRGERHVTGTQDRTGLWRAQTPQGFHYDALMAAYDAHPADAADDVEIARAAGIEVTIVEGCESNMKVTWPADLARAERMLKGTNMDIRLGNGYDVHRFGTGDHVWLCGIRVPHGRGLHGHSDADVGMHALTDAIYGALAEGDIGRHFPPSDMKWKGAASHIFLEHAMQVAKGRGFRLANCDVTLVCEYPKVGPHAAAMQAELARIMGVEVGRVSVKATTSEKLGFTGREEGIAAIATAALIAE